MCRPGGRRCPSSKSKSHGGGRPSRSAKAVAVRNLSPDLAEGLHAAWQAQYDRRTYGDRVETTTDFAYIREHGTDEVVLNKTAFTDLPGDLKSSGSLGDAVSVMSYISNNLNGLDKLKDGKRSRNAAGEFLQREWLKRNKWGRAFSELNGKFTRTSPEHQAKLMSHLDAGLELLEPTRTVHFEMFSSSATEGSEQGSAFRASAHGGGPVQSGEEIVDVQNFKRRRNGTFEGGTPRYKYSGELVIQRKPLVESKPRKRRVSRLEKSVIDSSAQLFGDHDLLSAKEALRADTPSKGAVRSARAEAKRALRDARKRNYQIRKLLADKLPEGTSVEEAIAAGSEFHRPPSSEDDSLLFSLVTAEQGSRDLADTADLLLQRLDSKHGKPVRKSATDKV